MADRCCGWLSQCLEMGRYHLRMALSPQCQLVRLCGRGLAGRCPVLCHVKISKCTVIKIIIQIYEPTCTCLNVVFPLSLMQIIAQANKSLNLGNTYMMQGRLGWTESRIWCCEFEQGLMERRWLPDLFIHGWFRLSIEGGLLHWSPTKGPNLGTSTRLHHQMQEEEDMQVKVSLDWVVI